MSKAVFHAASRTWLSDVKPYMRGSAFRELENSSYFKQVRPAHRGIMCPQGQDFSSYTII